MSSRQRKASPIFIVGNSRSGTTMMGRILNRSTDIHTFHEIHFFEELVSPEELEKKINYSKATNLLSNLISIERQGYLSKRTPKIFNNESKELINNQQLNDLMTPADLFDVYLNYESERNGKSIPCDQTPRNLYYLSEIFEHFPEAKVINMIRDPRDVLLSQKNKWRRRFLGAKNIPLREAIRSWINYHPFLICKLWVSSIDTIERYMNHPNVVNVQYEELVFHPQNVIKNVCHFLDIDFQKEMLEIPKIGSSTNKDEFTKSGIRKDRAFAWKKGGLSDTELYICQKICNSKMVRHNYKEAVVHRNLGKHMLFYLLLPIRVGLSFIINIRRYRNISDSIKRRLRTK